MRAGRMRFRVTLQDFTVAKSALNQSIKTYATIGTYWADITSLSGRELANAQQVKGNVTHKVTMRWVGLTIKPDYRILFEGRTFQILWTDNVDQRNRTLLIYCNEEVAG